MNKLLAAFCLIFTTHAFANTLAQQAEDAFALRDYNVTGAQNTQSAIDLYQQAIDNETDQTLKAAYQNKQASAYYFLGTALEKKSEKKQAHLDAIAVSETVMSTYGVDADDAHKMSSSDITNLKNSLTDEEELLVADSLYTKAISLAQWGNLNGIASSIGQLPEVKGLLKQVEALGFSELNDYGVNRTLGRINFILPKLFGGDLEQSEKDLITATSKTLATGQRYSINGYNNVYLAETLYKRGKENQAKGLLKAFLAADFDTLKEGYEPENREALRLASELAIEWGM